MKKGTIFTFCNTTAVVLHSTWDDIHARNIHLCYDKKRLFWYSTANNWSEGERVEIDGKLETIIVEGVTIHKYDSILNSLTK